MAHCGELTSVHLGFLGFGASRVETFRTCGATMFGSRLWSCKGVAAVCFSFRLPACPVFSSLQHQCHYMLEENTCVSVFLNWSGRVGRTNGIVDGLDLRLVGSAEVFLVSGDSGAVVTLYQLHNILCVLLLGLVTHFGVSFPISAGAAILPGPPCSCGPFPARQHSFVSFLEPLG